MKKIIPLFVLLVLLFCACTRANSPALKTSFSQNAVVESGDFSYNAEIKVLEEYLPEMLSSDAILKVVEEVALGLGIEGGKENIGKLMGPVMAKLKGLAGGNEVKEAIQKFLG